MSNRDSTTGSTIGRALAEAREAVGLDLDDVAAQLRIRRDFLAALEQGRPDALPGVTYAIGYVRTYAAFLGLDVEGAVTQFKQEAAGLDKRTELVFPSPAPEGRVPGVGLMLASVLLAGIAYGGWYLMSERGMSVYDMVPEVPERLATLIEGQDAAPAPPVASSPSTSSPSAPSASGAEPERPVASPAPATDYRAANPSGVPVTARSTDLEPTETMGVRDVVPPAIETEVEDPAPASETDVAVAAAPAEGDAAAAGAVDVTTAGTGTQDAPAGDVPTAGGLAEEAPQPAATPPETTEPTQAQAAVDPGDSSVPSAPRLSGLIGASEAAVPGPGADQTPAPIERIIVRATGESWVQVRAQDGTTLFTRVLREGDVYRVPDRSGLTLATGNAGALEVLVDGKPAPTLGTFGEVVRNIILDPSRLASGTAISGRN